MLPENDLKSCFPETRAPARSHRRAAELCRPTFPSAQGMLAVLVTSPSARRVLPTPRTGTCGHGCTAPALRDLSFCQVGEMGSEGALGGLACRLAGGVGPEIPRPRRSVSSKIPRCLFWGDRFSCRRFAERHGLCVEWWD